MRDNGVPNFPDPDPNGGIQIDGNKPGLDPNGTAFKAAQQACQKYQPTPPSGGPTGPSTWSNR
jgi:hypothetical protein